MGTEADYRAMAHRAHLKTTNVEDLTDRVSRTWSLCARRLVAKLLTQPSYFRFLIGNASSNRIFALTILRLLLAYRTHAMRYCLMVFERDAVT
jgi:tocopherol O-methyltransferase